MKQIPCLRLIKSGLGLIFLLGLFVFTSSTTVKAYGTYSGCKTQIIEEGRSDGTGPVHRSILGDSLGEYLMSGKITYARPIK